MSISLLQAVIGMFLIAAATHHDIARAGGLSNLVNRLDGVKMLALAAVAAYLSARRTSDRRPPNWLRATAALAAAALAVSGLDYLLLANSLAWTVYISGPLLLAWIAATGIWLTRSSLAGAPVCRHDPAGRPGKPRPAIRPWPGDLWRYRFTGPGGRPEGQPDAHVDHEAQAILRRDACLAVRR